MRIKPLSHLILASAVLVTPIASSATAHASETQNSHKEATSKDTQSPKDKGQKTKASTKDNVSKPIDFDKAKKMSPKEIKESLTSKDKKLLDKDINDSGSKNKVNDRQSSPQPKMRMAFSRQSSINNYIKNNNFKPAPIKEDRRIDNLPKYNYKTGKYVGVVIHDTANDNSTLDGEVNYMYNNYQNAFVHAYVDGSQIRQTAPADYLSWGVGPIGNSSFYNIELVHAHSYNEFAKSVNNDAYLTAYMLKRNGLKPKLADTNGGRGTIISHNGVSKYYGGTDHTDPISYFQRWGYDMQQYTDLVQYHYDKLNGITNAPSDKIKGDTHKMVKGDTLYNISKRSGVSVANLKKYNNIKDVKNLKIGTVLKLKPSTTTISGDKHKVVKGDTLYSISKKSGVSIDNLKKWNHLKDNTIHINQVIYLVPSHQVQKGETLYRIAKANNMSVTQLKKINNLKNDTIKIGQMLKLK